MNQIEDPSYRRALKKGSHALREWYLAQLERVRQTGDEEDEWAAIYWMIHSPAYRPDRDRGEALYWYRKMLKLPAPSAQLALYTARWLYEWIHDDELALKFVAIGYETFWRKREPNQIGYLEHLKRLELAIYVHRVPGSTEARDRLLELVAIQGREGEDFLLPAISSLANVSGDEYWKRLVLAQEWRHYAAPPGFGEQRRPELVAEIEALLSAIPDVPLISPERIDRIRQESKRQAQEWWESEDSDE